MNRIYLFLSCLFFQILMMACHKDEIVTEKVSKFSLELSVSSRNGDKGAEQDDINERKINKIYVFAFDDNYPTEPDYKADTKVKGSQDGTYQLKMSVRDIGKKRFYLFVNPPTSIENVLTDKDNRPTEGRLKSLTIDMNKPTKNNSAGLPMSNCFEAYVDGLSNDNHTNSKADEVFLFPDKLRKNNKIVEIPVFRSLGKITVKAYLKDGGGQVIRDGKQTAAMPSITNLAIFNFNANGSALPIWNLVVNQQNYWMPGGATSNDNYVWNTDLKLDLKAMSEKEVLIVNDITPLENINTKPISSSDRENPDYITHFYLCQNSFGKKIDSTNEQDGVEDVDGNRTTKMIVTLSDGRVSAIPLPYLRRNDNLQVRLAINKFKIDAEFLLWKQSLVTPDWDEQISPSPIK